MKVKYEFTADEISRHMRVIGETYKLGSRITETGRGRRLFHSMIPDEYKATALKLVDKCKHVYSHGIKESVALSAEEYVALRYLVDYVMSL